LRHAAEAIVAAACLRKRLNVLIVCGVHNKFFAEYIALESYRVSAYPYIWMFDENFFVRCSKAASRAVLSVLPEHMVSLIKKSDVVIWLSQFEDIERISAPIRRSIYSFWETACKVIKAKPRLLVNLPSAKFTEGIGIDYMDFLQTFTDAVRVDHKRIRKTGLEIASALRGKRLIHISDSNGTDLRFSIEGRRIGVEIGTLKDCFSTGKGCETEIPAGEVYVAPQENSANGVLVVDELRDYGVQGFQLRFERGRIMGFEAERGCSLFKKVLEKAEGDKDRIAEFGVGINYGMTPIGWSIYDEKALGTAHIAIGNNLHLGGVNKASIHVDFVLRNPTITADNESIMEKGEFTATTT